MDHCHEQVIRALQNDGWAIEHTPVRIYLPYRTIDIDVAITRANNGTHQQILLVEVKCFPDEKDTRELYGAFGQYLIYRAMIREAQRDYALYLSVPSHVFGSVFDPAVMRVVTESKINLLIVNLEQERLIRWITHESP